MAYLRCEIFSQALDMTTSFAAILPETGSLSDCPVIYLLHGRTDNCTCWTRFTAVERYARDLGAAVIMPEVQLSYYTDMAFGQAYFTYVSRELPKICARMFGLSQAREKNYVMGLSMGGYGALKCALTNPERFAGCAAFSAVADIAGWVSRKKPSSVDFRAVFGPDGDIPPQARLDALLEEKNTEALPRFFLTCGEQDVLYSQSCRFGEELLKKGCDVTFRHWPEDHTWPFWDDSVEMAMHYFLDAPGKN